MYDKVYFYNHFGAGDIFESREFVKAWMEIIPANDYFYAHGKHPSILADIPTLKYCEVNSLMDGMRDIAVIGNNLYVNTWIGRDGSYVLPGIGCTVDQLYRMHNDMLGKITEKRLNGKPYDYFTDIDFSYYKTDEVDKFINTYKSVDKILISNGPVQSCQADNFDFFPIIEKLSIKFPDKFFLLTSPYSDIAFDNVFFTQSIIGKFSFDLNEIAYLSRFCNTIIGRSSGPFTFASTKENWDNPDKKFISFTYTMQGSSFAVLQDTKASKYWSSATTTDEVVSTIERIIG